MQSRGTTVKINLHLNSADAQSKLRAWGGQLRPKVREATRRALVRQQAPLKQDVRDRVAGELKVVKRAFLKSFTTTVYDRDPNRLPALYIGSRVPWAGIHESGGSISGKLLIPLYGARMGPKTFKALITRLIAGGNAWFTKNRNGHTVLMAENIGEHDALLRNAKRRYRKAEGIKRLKRGADVPIAVLVPRVTLRQRLDVRRLVESRTPRIADAIQKQLAALR